MAVRNAIGTPKIVLGGTFTMTGGAYTFTGTLTNNTSVTFHTSGTLATLSDIPAINPQALTSTSDSNVTITLGGTPTTALLQPVSITMGWTGQLAVSRGGTGLASVAQGDILYSNATNTFTTLTKDTNA